MRKVEENEEFCCAVCGTMCQIRVPGGADFEPEFCPFDGKKTAVWFSVAELEQMQEVMKRGSL